MTIEDVITQINEFQVLSKRFIRHNPACDSISWEIVNVPISVYKEIAVRFEVSLSKGSGQFCIGHDNCFIHIYSKPS